MKKLVVAGFSLVAVGLLVLGSQTNVVGYQTVQTSQQTAINESINQKDVLFQTILDLANNKDIQRIILTSQTNAGGRFAPIMKSQIITQPTLTKNQLNQIYMVGVILSKFISTSKMHSIAKQHRVIDEEMQSEITAIIENDARLNGEVTQLSSQSCNCGIESNFTWHFPVICSILLVPFFICIILFAMSYGAAPIANLIGIIICYLAAFLNCRWF